MATAPRPRSPSSSRGTFLDTIPGIDAAWTILGILESAIFVLIVVSLIRLEFMPGRRKSFLLCSMALAIFTFSILAMGQNVVGENSGVAELFVYAAATGVLIGLVLLMPPCRRQLDQRQRRWVMIEPIAEVPVGTARS